MVFSIRAVRGLWFNPCLTTSSALSWNFCDERSNCASLCSTMYWSSEAGKAGDMGTATAWLPRIESRVTASHQRAPGTTSRNAARTYIVVAVLHQERYPLALGAPPTNVLRQLRLGLGDVVDQVPVREAASGERVHDGGAPGIVAGNRLEDGQPGQGGSHSEERRRRAGEQR